jgi:hypothetical protein
MRTLEPGTRTLLEDLVPDYDVASRHGLWIAAPPHVVYRVVRSVDLGSPWLVRLLMGVRALPARLAAGLKRRRGGSAAARGPTVGGASFTVVAEAPGFEVVLGILGRFWTYWRVIRFGSGWIRLSTLRSIRRIAEASSRRTS